MKYKHWYKRWKGQFVHDNYRRYCVCERCFWDFFRCTKDSVHEAKRLPRARGTLVRQQPKVMNAVTCSLTTCNSIYVAQQQAFTHSTNPHLTFRSIPLHLPFALPAISCILNLTISTTTKDTLKQENKRKH